MKRITFLVGILFFLSACGGGTKNGSDTDQKGGETADDPPADTGGGQNAPWKGDIETTYSGRIATSQNMSDSAPVHETFVIRDEKAFKEFVERIPKVEITKQQPAPPSDDPLLKAETPDFSKVMLIVAVRGDTMYVAPKIAKIDKKDGRVQVLILHPALGETAMLNAAYGIGTYTAVVLPKYDGKVVFETDEAGG